MPADAPGEPRTDRPAASPPTREAAPAARTEPAADESDGGFDGPPPDAVTSYEDLPHDLFGEAEPPPAGGEAPNRTPSRAEGPSGPTPEAPAAPTRDADEEGAPAPVRARPGGPRGGGPERPDGPDDGVRDAGDAGGDDPVEMVQRLFPGRILGIEPLDEEGDEAGDEAAEDADASVTDATVGARDDGVDLDADGRPDDGPGRTSG